MGPLTKKLLLAPLLTFTVIAFECILINLLIASNLFTFRLAFIVYFITARS